MSVSKGFKSITVKVKRGFKFCGFSKRQKEGVI